MKAVKLVVFMMVVLLMSGRQVLAQYEPDESDTSTVQEESNEVIDLSADPEETSMTDEQSLTTEDASIDDEGETEIKEAADALINELENAVSIDMNEESSQEGDQPAEDSQGTEQTSTNESAGGTIDEAVVDAIKAEIAERRKASGNLDIFDGKANKVRTLDLIDFKDGVKTAEDHEYVQADFRDTSSGDIVTLDIQLAKDETGYVVKDMTVASVSQPVTNETKAEYTDEEVMDFMKGYIETQSQATGTFDLYDEKAQKMRNLKFVGLEEKLRRYGIIAISTAEFTDKNTGDVVKVDVNVENKNGLGITAMRLKSVKKAPVAK